METIPTEVLDRLLSAMVNSAEGISDLLFVPGKPPQAEIHGVLESVPVNVAEPALTGPRIEALARTILNGNAKLLQDFFEHGSCDCSYALQDSCRFRVNIYRQNGNFAMVLRRLPAEIPTMASLGLPPICREIVKENNGLIFVTGGSGNGKTTTLAAMLHEINLVNKTHIVTLIRLNICTPTTGRPLASASLGAIFTLFPTACAPRCVRRPR